MDFIVELPNSQGNTVIVMVVDRFSKMLHCIPLKKLPTSKELASIFAWEIFHLHGLPKVIVSDRGSLLCTVGYSACFLLCVSPAV